MGELTHKTSVSESTAGLNLFVSRYVFDDLDLEAGDVVHWTVEDGRLVGEVADG